jgi:DNA-directed RNA polymerase subunit RPC12/RpoP
MTLSKITKNYCCIDCGKKIWYTAIRCFKCSINFKNKNSKSKCIDCGKRIKKSCKTHIRCYDCYMKLHMVMDRFCIDCGKEITKYSSSIRCKSCARKGKISSIPKRIFYNKIKFRSGWEASFAQWCDSSGIKWKYESKTFDLGNTTYTPDFYLPEFDCYIEIKGWMRSYARNKINLFIKRYKKINYKIFSKKELQEFGVIK